LVLISEVYGITADVDIVYVIGSTLNLIIKQLDLLIILIIIYIDSYSLYECLVKLGIIKEKRLIIDIIAI
jgi:hypothetical protein